MNHRKVGAALSYISIITNIVIGIIYVPIMLSFFNTSEYGLYQMMGSILAYFSVMDFGLSHTITRYYSKYIALKDKTNQENILAISAIIYLIISAFCIFAGGGVYSLMDIIYSSKFSAAELESAKKILIVIIINVAVTIPSNIFTSILNSKERFAVIKIITIIQHCLQPAAVILVLQKYPYVMAVIVVQTLFNFFMIAVKAYISLFRLKVKIKLHKWDGSLVREMAGFSFFVFIGVVVDMVYWKTGQLILGAVMGTASIAVYSFSSQICSYFMNFSSAISSVFLPKISRVSTLSDNMDQLNDIFRRLGRIQFFIVSLIFSGFILFGKQFLLLWAKEGSEPAYYMTIIVMASLVIPLSQNTGILILQAKNKHTFRSVVYIVIAVLNVICSIPLARRYGGMGCAISNAFFFFLGNNLIINIYYSKIGLEIAKFIKELAKALPAILIAFGLGSAIFHFISAGGFIALAIQIVAYSLLFLGALWLLAFNNYEKMLLSDAIKKILGLFKRIIARNK